MPESVDLRCLSRDTENIRELCGRQDKSLRAALFKRAASPSPIRCGDAEHEMTGDLGMSADPDMAPAELILETGVGPLDTGTDPEPQAFGTDIACHPPGPGFPVQLLLENLVPARVDIDDRNMAKAFTHLVDPPGVISSVHEIVEVGHTPGGHHRQRDCDLAVMDRCRSENGAQYSAIRCTICSL